MSQLFLSWEISEQIDLANLMKNKSEKLKAKADQQISTIIRVKKSLLETALEKL